MKKLKTKLRDFIKTEHIIDIFIIGSVLKDKENPRDIDIIVLFRRRDYTTIEEVLYAIKKALESSGIQNTHIEPLVADDLFTSKITRAILHEGQSIKNNKQLSQMLNVKAYSLFSFTLKRQTNVQKVRFAQALYGRKNNGLLKMAGGQQLGRGSFLVPVEKTEFFRELLKKHNVSFSLRRSFVND